MTRTTLRFLALAALLAAWLGLGLAGCNSDDDDEEDARDDMPDDDDNDDNDDNDDDTSPADDDDNDDTSPADDDDNDDTSPDDDDDDDNDDDDNDDDNDDTAFDSLRCEPATDPLGLLPNLLGGGTIDNLIEVYVWDDFTCAPIENAAVYLNTETPVYTDANGHAQLAVTAKGPQMVTAYKYDWLGGQNDYRAWSYTADARSMYFRLQPYEPSATWNDSGDGHFTSGGSPLALSNPDAIGQVFTQPIYFGFAAPGITRNGLLASDVFGPAAPDSEYGFYTYENLLAQSTFELDLDLGDPVYYLVASNVYLPAIDLTLLDYGISGANEAYKLPVRVGASVSPIAGGVLSIDVAEALPTLPELTDIIVCLASGGEVLDCVGELIVPLLNGAHVAYGGIEPTWTGAGAPDVAAASAAKGAYELAIENQDPLVDYVALSLAEIPYRGMVPEAIRFMETADPMLMDYFELPDVKHVVMAAKTNLVDEAWDEFSFSAAAQVITDTADFAADLTFDGNDFLPLFDPASTYYDFNAGTLHWALDGSTDGIDAWVVFLLPANTGADLVAIMPPMVDSWSPPPGTLPGGPSRYDGAGVIGIDLPDGVSLNALNAVEILAYDSPRAVFWTNEFDLFVNHPQP